MISGGFSINMMYVPDSITDFNIDQLISFSNKLIM